MSLQQFDPLSLALFLAALSLMPLMLVCTTCFLKVSMVLMIVRNAIGVQQVPPGIAIYSIALSITLFVMAPVLREISAATPLGQAQEFNLRKFTVDDAVTAVEPLRRFMLRNTLPEGRERFVVMARKQAGAGAANVRDSDYVVLIPAFVISELQLAFEVGFVLYVPMVVIDLLMSNLLLALGMQMVSPMVISMPLKILLFVVLDGWTKVFEGLVQSYAGGTP